MHRIIIQIASEKTFVPKKSLLRKWAKSALREQPNACEVTIRIVDIKEMTTLNTTYRHKKGPTNVLSFPIDLPKNVILDKSILGDIIICAEIVNKEAKEQGKSKDAHWAHMIIHGVFHLQGYDHEEDCAADQMESLEIVTLQHLGFNNPYEHGENTTHHD